MARLRVRRDTIDRASPAHRSVYASLEIDTTPRTRGTEDVTAYVDGEQMLIGPLRPMLAALKLTLEDLE